MDEAKATERRRQQPYGAEAAGRERQQPYDNSASGREEARLRLRANADLAEDMTTWEQTGDHGRMPCDMTPMSDASPSLIYEVRDIMVSALGIVRNGASLKEADEALKELLKRKELNQREKNRIQVARAIVGSARFRKESRGAHYREDFPERDDAFRGITVAQMKYDGCVTISLEESS